MTKPLPSTVAEREELARRLVALPSAELVDVLRRAFEGRSAFEGEEAFCESRLYLGIASRDLVSGPDAPEEWGVWEFEAAGYIDREHYAESGWTPANDGDVLGPRDDGFPNEGRCGCGLMVRAGVKNAICPACGRKVYLT